MIRGASYLGKMLGRTILRSRNLTANGRLFNTRQFSVFNQLLSASPAEAAQESTDDAPDEKPPAAIKSSFQGKIAGESTQYEFKAETNKLLDIVANSLYSEKEVFCRELISNAADALEKLRHAQSTGDMNATDANPMEIHIELDKENQTFSLQDFGIGMTKQELVDLLGTIARSGSKAFMEKAENEKSSAKSNIIGQFGVGFYSAFMVGKSISVFTRSAKDADSKGYCWTSNGSGSYEISEAENVPTGTRIVIQLKDNSLDFAKEATVEEVIKKYSNFVSFPVKVNGRVINTVQPLWSMDKESVTDEQHKNFYRFVANAWDNYQYKFHFKTDAPIHVASLLYVPERHNEYMGMGRMESGTNLYSRRVLIKAKANLLPEYLRFIKGVVDSEDLSMNLSREMVQKSHAMKKLKDIMTGKVIKWLQDEAKRDEPKYLKFFNDFGTFLREGVCTADVKHQKELAKLLRYESSATKPGEKTSLAAYIERKPEDQKKIFFLVSPTRKWAEESPYFEQMRKKGTEVLFMVGDSMDEFVTQNLHEFGGCQLVSVDSADASLSPDAAADEKSESNSDTLSADQTCAVVKLFKDTLGNSLSDVKISKRDHSYPAIVTGHESPTIRKMMKMVPQTSGMYMDEAPQNLELNPNHAIIRGLSKAMHESDKTELCQDVVKQVFDNALIVAGIMDDPRVMLKRLNTLLERSLSTGAEVKVDEVKSAEKGGDKADAKKETKAPEWAKSF